MNSYELSRLWFNWCFENPEKIKPNHTALYFFIIEHCNRMGWAKKFGLPTEMAKSAIGISSYGTYIKTLNDLIEWGFIIMVQKSQNQFSSNIIALSNFDKALDKALDKATQKHVSKHVLKQHKSIDSINKQITNNKEQRTESGAEAPTSTSSLKSTLTERKDKFKNSLAPFLETYGKDMLNKFYSYWSELNKPGTKMKWELQQTFEVKKRLATWAARDNQFTKPDKNQSITVNV